MSVRYRKTQLEMPQMPGVSPDQNIRQKEKIIDLTDGQLGVDEIGLPAATSPANGNLLLTIS